MESFWKGAFLPLRKDCGGNAADVEYEVDDEGTENETYIVTFYLGNTRLEYEMSPEMYEDWEQAEFSVHFYNDNIRMTPTPYPFGSPGFGNGDHLKDK